jgi:hypothetical protein
MRLIQISVALVLAMAGPALAASTSAKMTGQDQNPTGPSYKASKSSKMHGTHPSGSVSKHQSPPPGGGAQ